MVLSQPLIVVLGKSERRLVMNPKISHQKYCKLALLGYGIIGASCNGFYQYLYFHAKTFPLLFWVFCAFIGSIILVAKNILGSNDKFRSILLDFSFIIPVVFIPRIPPRHDIMMILMLVYACAFVIIFGKKNHNKVD